MLASLSTSAEPIAQVNLNDNDPYQALGLGLEATVDEIKKKYRELSLLHHPDKNPEDIHANQRFQQLSDAYNMLLDSGFRERYSLVQGIDAALQQYTQRPQVGAFITVYTAVYDLREAKERKVEDILKVRLNDGVSHSIGALAGCLRQPLHKPHLSWMKSAISVMHHIRNHLYCLQSAFAQGGRSNDFPVSFEAALRDAKCLADIDELGHGFWQNVRAAVGTADDCVMILPDLVECWCRLGCTIIGLRAPAFPPNDSPAYDAMRVAFAAYNAKRLSPGLLNPTVPNTCPFDIRNKVLITVVAGFLSHEDLQKSFCLNRGSGRARRSALMPNCSSHALCTPALLQEDPRPHGIGPAIGEDKAEAGPEEPNGTRKRKPPVDKEEEQAPDPNAASSNAHEIVVQEYSPDSEEDIGGEGADEQGGPPALKCSAPCRALLPSLGSAGRGRVKALRAWFVSQICFAQ